MKDTHTMPVAVFAAAMRLYPARFRAEYREQMLQTLADAHADRRENAVRFWALMFRDVVESAVAERGRMLRESMRQKRIVVHAVLLGAVLTGLGFVAAITLQQVLRRGANQPQEQMTDIYARLWAQGGVAAVSLPQQPVDMRESLEPFAILFDDAGNPMKSSGQLDGAVPRPPAGVFAYLREHGTDTFTWQPRPGVRIAAVMRRVNDGYVLVGRSLRVTEAGEARLRMITFSGWFLVVGMLIVGALFLRRAERRPQLAV